MSGIRSHYDVLGVPNDASAVSIRDAYRALARTHHPDRVRVDDEAGSLGSRPEMTAINEAYRILSTPSSRATYDATLRSNGGRGSAVGGEAPTERFEAGESTVVSPPSFNLLHPEGPARIPWRLMAVLVVAGSLLVLASAALTDPPAVQPPDGILQIGSCVSIEPNLDVREIGCSTSTPNLVVRRVLPVGSTCPAAYATHRDRLGLSTVCVAADS